MCVERESVCVCMKTDRKSVCVCRGIERERVCVHVEREGVCM